MKTGAVKPLWLQGMVDFFFPPLCLGCGEYTENESSICDLCLKAIETFDRPFCLRCMNIMPTGHKCGECKTESLPLFAYGNYAHPLEDIIIQYKFKGIKTPAGFIAKLFHQQFHQAIGAIDSRVLVPIPLHPARENRRGYNQATLFANELAAQFGFEVDTGILSRTKKRKEQARLNHRDRVANIRGVFEVNDEAGVDGSVVLVDDVVTSGSTVREAVRVLKESEIEVAAVFAMAHAM
jgi:ComF family protein